MVFVKAIYNDRQKELFALESEANVTVTNVRNVVEVAAAEAVLESLSCNA